MTYCQIHATSSGCSTPVMFRPSIPITSHALFTELTLLSGESDSPELYPRPDDTMHMYGDHADPFGACSLPTRAVDVIPSPHALKNQAERLKWLGGRGLNVIKVEVEQAFFGPESRRCKLVIYWRAGQGDLYREWAFGLGDLRRTWSWEVYGTNHPLPTQ